MKTITWAGLTMTSATALATASWGAPPTQPPVARVAPVTDTYFGQTVTDNYRWMEARPPEFTDWMRAQDTVTRSELQALPGYAKLAQEVAALSAGTEVPVSLTVAGDRIFYQKRPQGTTQFKLFVAPLAGGPERMLVDPLAAPLGGADGAVDQFQPSPDGRKLVVGISLGGSEESVLHILDVATGHVYPEAIDRARFASATWDPNGHVFYYNRLKPATPDMSPHERFQDETVYAHTLGTDPATDRPVFATKDVDSALGRDGFAFLFVPPGSKWSFAAINSGVSHESEFWVAPTASLGLPKVPWRKIATLDDKIGSNAIGGLPMVAGDQVYLMSFKDALNWKLVRLDLAHPGSPAVTVLPESDRVLVGAVQAKDGIYLVSKQAGVFGIERFDPMSGHATPVALPYAGAVIEAAADPATPGIVFSVDAWTRPTSTFHATPGRQPVVMALAKPFPRDLSPYVSEELSATAPDGTAIPVSVIRRRDLRMDGHAPAIVEAYGAYGTSIDPGLSPRMLAWYDRGGIYAIVHVRGGGENGERWHLAGKGDTKPNTWRDFIAGVSMLESTGYSSKATAAGWGTSAGGIMIGRTVTERPDLLNAAIINVGLSDTLRFETSEGGPANVAEFGTVKDAAGYKGLYQMSAYHHVVDGTRYPATLVTAGMNDHRVPAWEGGKMAARLQAAQAPGGPPIRLRVEFDAGHGMGSSKTTYDGFYTDMMAFVLHADGAPGF